MLDDAVGDGDTGVGGGGRLITADDGGAGRAFVLGVCHLRCVDPYGVGTCGIKVRQGRFDGCRRGRGIVAGGRTRALRLFDRLRRRVDERQGRDGCLGRDGATGNVREVGGGFRCGPRGTVRVTRGLYIHVFDADAEGASRRFCGGLFPARGSRHVVPVTPVGGVCGEEDGTPRGGQIVVERVEGTEDGIGACGADRLCRDRK